MSARTIASVAVGLVVAVVGISAVFGSWYSVDQGERGVLLTNGAYTATENPGLHFKLPFFQDVEMISLRQHVLHWSGQSRMEAYSKDQQAAMLTVSVNYHVTEAEVPNVYSIYRSVEGLGDTIIARKAPQQVKTVFGQFNAVSVIQDRAQFNAEVTKAVQRAVDGPVIIDSVQVEDISFSKEYENAVEARMTAEVEVQKEQQQLAQEKIKAEIAVTQAQGRANSVKAEADAKAYSTKVQGEAQADAIKARAAALGQNPLIVELTKAERWNGVLPTTVLPSSAVPFLSAKQ